MLTDAAPQKLTNSTIYLFTSQTADGSPTNKQIWFETKAIKPETVYQSQNTSHYKGPRPLSCNHFRCHGDKFWD